VVFQQNDWCIVDLITKDGRTKAFINTNREGGKKTNLIENKWGMSDTWAQIKDPEKVT